MMAAPGATPANPANVLPHSSQAPTRLNLYIRDAYDRLPKSNLDPIIQMRAEGDYVSYIRRLAAGWPHVQYLADFMDVTTSPPKLIYLDDTNRRERAQRTTVAVLDFGPGGCVKRTDCRSNTALDDYLKTPQDVVPGVEARLYVVEDLSSDVIEALGAKFDIDPHFFRGQISDYMWHNPRDPWAELPTLDVLSRHRPYACTPYFQPRYFRDSASLTRAKGEAGAFNVLRRIDSNHRWEGREDFDQPGSEIGLVRSKMSCWIRKNAAGEQVVLAILLVDPTIEEGFPLWGGYNNFHECPSMRRPSRIADVPPRLPLFEEVIYWTRTLSPADIGSLRQDPRLLMKKALLVVCAEWTTLTRYLTTRLTQLEWELEDTPDTPFRNPTGLDRSLTSLNMWRRRMPVYQEWLAETAGRVICPTSFGHGGRADFSGLQADFAHLQGVLAAVTVRADRIEGSIAAIISIEESKKAMLLNQSAARLTYLAVIFVPLAFVSSLFSMTVDVTQLGRTFWIYFLTAIPLTLLALAVLRYSAILDLFMRVSDKMSK